MKHSSTFRSIRDTRLSTLTAILVVLSLTTFTVPQAQGFGGGSGNPFGNGSFFSTDGSFQAVLRGPNVTGVVNFSTSSVSSSLQTTASVTDEAGGAALQEQQVATSGSFTIYANGITYNGNVQASVSGSTISATLEGSNPGQGNGTSSSLVSSVFGLTDRTVVEGGTTTATVTDTGRTNSVSTTNVTGATLETTTTGPQTNSSFENTATSGDILTFTFSPTDNVAGGVVIVSTDNAVSISPGNVTQSSINPVLPGLGTNSTTITTNVTGLQTNSVSTSGQTNSTTNQEITGANTLTTETTTPDQVSETYGLINTLANSTFVDSDYVSGNFIAKLSNSFPNQVLNGNGSLTFQMLDTSGPIPRVVSETVQISVSGQRTSDTAGSYVNQTVTRPSVVTTYQTEVSNGGGGGN